MCSLTWYEHFWEARLLYQNYDLSASYQIVSGQQLPKVNMKKSSIVDPLVRVQVFGVPADVAEKETEHIDNNGTNLTTCLSVTC